MFIVVKTTHPQPEHCFRASYMFFSPAREWVTNQLRAKVYETRQEAETTARLLQARPSMWTMIAMHLDQVPPWA